MRDKEHVLVDNSGDRNIGVIHYGLGPIGRSIATIVAERPWLTSIAAIDADPTIAGAKLSQVCGFTASGRDPDIVSTLADARTHGASVVIHCTGSSLQRVAPQLIECLQMGLSVVSTCEELAFAQGVNAPLLLELDAVARDHGARVVGTGINPGYAMDYLPMVLCAVSRRVDSITVRRRQNASIRRLPLQRKVGAGLTIDQFDEGVAAHTIGHVGLQASAAALADALGWQVERLEETIAPLVATQSLVAPIGEIALGNVTGIDQTVEAHSNGRQVISLSLQMAVELSEPADEIWIHGDPEIHMIIPGGLHGDVGTAAIVANVIPVLLQSEPGLRVMRDLPPMPPGRL